MMFERVQSRFTVDIVALALASLSVVACSNDASSGVPNDEGGSETPLYVIATNFSAGDQAETYLVTTPSFDESTTIDPTNGPKLLGGIVPVVRNGAVFIAEANGPIVTRYDVDARDQLEKGAELSFAGVGMTEILSWHVYAVSDTKGYVFDPAGTRIIVWNPRTMELTGQQIDLSEAARDGFSPNLAFEHSGPKLRGNQLFVPLGWQDQDGNARFASGVLVIDVETDEVVTIDEDPRCGESYVTVESPDGDIYFFPPDWSSAPHYFVDMHQPTCVARIRRGETTFDDAEPLDLSALGSSSAASGAVPDGRNGFFFTAVDEELWGDGGNSSGAVWRFWHYDFVTEESRLIDFLPPWAGQGYYLNVGDELFIPSWKESSTGYETTLYRVDGSEDPVEVFSFEANWFGAGRLR